MPIAVTCPSCHKTFRVKDEFAGKKAKCACGQALSVPIVGTSVPKASPPREPRQCSECGTPLGDKSFRDGESVLCKACYFTRPSRPQSGSRRTLFIGVGAAAALVITIGLYFGLSGERGAKDVDKNKGVAKGPDVPLMPDKLTPLKPNVDKQLPVLDDQPHPMTNPASLAEWQTKLQRVPNDLLLVYLEASRRLAADGKATRFTLNAPGNMEMALDAPPPPEVLTLMEARVAKHRFPAVIPDELLSIWVPASSKLSAANATAYWRAALDKVIIDADTPQDVSQPRRLRGHDAPVKRVTFVSDTRALSAAFLGATPSFRSWDLVNGKDFKEWQGSVLAFSGDGRKALLGDREDGRATYFDMEKNQPIHALQGHKSPIFAAAFAPDGKRALTASGGRGGDASACLWELDSGNQIRRLKYVIKKPEDKFPIIQAIAYGPTAPRCLTGDNHGTVRLFDLDTGDQVRQFDHDHHVVTALMFSPDGRKAVSAGRDNLLCVWDVETGKRLAELRGHEGEVLCVTVSPDGRKALSGSYDRTMRLWDLDSGKQLESYRDGNGAVFGVAFSPDGRQSLSAGEDRLVRLWQVAK